MSKCKCGRDAERGEKCFPCLVPKEVGSSQRFKVDVPAGKSGAWEVSQFTVSKEDAEFDALRGMFGGYGRHTPVGTYTQLTRNGNVIMSDTPDEIRDHSRFILHARGKVLVAGLGLGMVTRGLLGQLDVEHVTVIEKSPDVIKLVGPVFADSKRATIIEGDIFEWKPAKGTTFDWAWFDVWDNICSDNLDEMGKLNRRFARIVPIRWHWGMELCKLARSRDRKMVRAFGR